MQDRFRGEVSLAFWWTDSDSLAPLSFSLIGGGPSVSMCVTLYLTLYKSTCRDSVRDTSATRVSWTVENREEMMAIR